MKIKNIKSKKLFSDAKKLMPGGVNSPVRSFKAVGGIPHFIAKGDGPLYLMKMIINFLILHVLGAL